MFNPFVTAAFGDFGVSAEAELLFGKYREYDRDIYNASVKLADSARKLAGLTRPAGRGLRCLRMEHRRNLGFRPFGAEIGYAWVKGEDNYFDDKYESVGGVGDDWCKAFILTNTDSASRAPWRTRRRCRCRRHPGEPGLRLHRC